VALSAPLVAALLPLVLPLFLALLLARLCALLVVLTHDLFARHVAVVLRVDLRLLGGARIVVA